MTTLLRSLAARLGTVAALTLALAACDSAAPDLDAAGVTADGRRAKAEVCHRTGSDDNPFVLIEVSENAVEAHRRHGDALPGEPVPGTEGAFVSDEACVPQPVEPPDEETVDVVAGLSCPAGLLTGETGTFTGSVNDDATGPLTFTFDFDTDGTTDASGSLEETHAFDTAGTYTVTFVATGPENVSMKTCPVVVTDPVVPVEASVVSCPATLETGDTGTFSFAVNGDATEPLTYTFDFDGDGPGAPVTSDGTSEQNAFATADTYTVVFSATGPTDTNTPENSDTASCTVTVTDPAPEPVVPVVASLDCPATLEINEEGTFTGSVNDDATGPITFAFDFGSDGVADEEPSSTSQETGSYTTAGTATVTFFAYGPDNTDTDTCDVTVTGDSGGGGGGGRPIFGER